MKLRIGSVPYLNAKPLVDWFHGPECDADVEITYAVPSELARMLRNDLLDVANVSIFEGLRAPGLTLVSGISISAYGPVKSVRLFAKTPLDSIRSVALDTSSLTSVALVRILLSEAFGLTPRYEHLPPTLDVMLANCDAGLIIGDLGLFDMPAGTTVYDLGQGWYDLTGLAFVYAGWLTREENATPQIAEILHEAKRWGVERLDDLAQKWSPKMDLPLDRCSDYLINVMNYDLTPHQLAGLQVFQQKCYHHGLIDALHPLRLQKS